MSNIQTFKNSELGNVRVAGTKEQPLFCLKDVCDGWSILIQEKQKK